MVTDQEVKKLMKLIQKEGNLTNAAAKAGMDRKTARTWRDSGKLPSQVKKERAGRTRKDPFADVWEEIRKKLDLNQGLEAKTLFLDLQRRYPGKFSDGQLRTLQRRIKIWRATEGPPREIFFPQIHKPGILCQSDFTHMTDLGITIAGELFDHLIYHFVLTYSNWETGTICFSECFEALSEGLQNALWELGGVPREHRTDQLSTAVCKVESPEEFTHRYNALLSQYKIAGKKTQPNSPNENGDVEQRHYRFKRAVDQELMLRGSRDFETIEEYNRFIHKLFSQLNAGRSERFKEEHKVLRLLPKRRLESFTRESARVGPSSTIRVKNNTYSVASRLKGETVETRIHMDHIEVWYAQKMVECFPRLRGSGKHDINYRHIIDWLVRKPGAFANYRYREDLFPSSTFRVAYDMLNKQLGERADKEYLKILYLAKEESETGVEGALMLLMDSGDRVSSDAVEKILAEGKDLQLPTDVSISDVDLANYDDLFCGVFS
jgi:transposase